MNLTDKECEMLLELQRIMNAMGIDYIPSRSIINNYNSVLNSRIDKYGGIIKLSKILNIPLGSRIGHKKRKTNKDVEDDVNLIINKLNLDRFPSAKEIRDFNGDSSLTSLISHRGGFKFWADKMGYNLKESETNTGWVGEEIARKLLESNGYSADKMNTNCAYDFVVNNKIRVDIKYSKLYKGTCGNFYAFNLEQKFHDCDIYILICEEDNGNLKTIIIPQSFVHNQGQISIGEFKSKWYKYINRFDFIDIYDKVYKELEYLK